MPLHILLAMHVLEEEPIKSNPASHLKVTVLGKVVSPPSEEPLVGERKAPQSTAVRDEEIDHQNVGNAFQKQDRQANKKGEPVI